MCHCPMDNGGQRKMENLERILLHSLFLFNRTASGGVMQGAGHTVLVKHLNLGQKGWDVNTTV